MHLTVLVLMFHESMEHGVNEEEVIRPDYQPGYHYMQHPGHNESISYFRKRDSVSPPGACSVRRKDKSLTSNSKQPSRYLDSQWQVAVGKKNCLLRSGAQ